MKELLLQHKKVILGVVAVFLLIGIGVAVYFFVLNRGERVRVAAGTIALKATIEDSTGVDSKSAFILTSKQPLKANDIKSSLQITPGVDFDVQEVNAQEYKINLKKPLGDGKMYQFKLATVASEASGSATAVNKDLSWAFQIKSPFRVVQSLPKNKGTAVPTNSGIEVTFSHENYQDVNNFFEITPQVSGSFERHKRTVSFVPSNLQAGTLYTVKIKKGLGLTGSSETLKDDYVFQFETDAYQSPRAINRIGFTREMSEFPNTEKPAFSMFLSDAQSLPTLAVEVYKFNDINQFIAALKEKDKIPTWARFSRESYVQNTAGLQKVLSFSAPVQKFSYSGYFLFPQALSDGFYLVDTKHDNQTIQTWLQVTDVASYLTTSNTQTLAWVNDLSSKKAVSDAVVQLVDTSGSQKTNGDGVAFFATPKEVIGSDIRRYFKVTTPTGKSSIVPVDQTTTYNNYFAGRYDNPTSASQQYWTYLYLDRPIYLPTDKVGYWGVIRNRDNPKEIKPLKLTLTRSDYNDYNYTPAAIYESTVTPSEMGTFTGEIPLSNLNTGYYNLEVKLGNEVLVTNGFNVETYTKPAYKIDISSSKNAVFAGEQVMLSGKTRFFEGTAVPKVGLHYNGSVQGDITTNDQGDFQLPYTPQYVDDGQFYNTYPTSHYFTFTPSLAEEGNIEGGVNVTVFGPNIDVKSVSQVTADKGKITYTVNTITLDRLNNGTAKDTSDYLGGLVPGQTLTGKLYEYHYDKKETGQYYDFVNKVTQKLYDYTPVKTFLSDISVTTDGNGQAVYEFPLAQDKYYQVEIEATDNQNRKVRMTDYLYGRQSETSQGQSYYHLVSQKKDDAQFSVNESVNLSLQKGQDNLPSGGDNKYLFRLAQRGIKDYRIQNSPDYSFNFVDSYVPNIVAKAIYFNGKTYFEGESLPINFRKSDRQLAIDVKADKDSYQPQDTVNLDVTVKDKNGAGQKAEVNVSLVDEAIFKIQGQDVNTLGDLYKSVASGIIQSYASHQYPNEVSGAEGGGCFLAGTKILLPNHQQKNIEDIKAGDIILTRENERSSRLVEAKVSKTFSHVVGEYLVVNGNLRVTPEHNLYVNGRWMVAADLKLRDHLLNTNDKWIEVTSIERRTGQYDVYNFEVEKYGTYFANNLFVHNEKGRELFTDRAYFGSIKTDASGKGKTSFKLPDNLTSWRITYQGISEALGAGNGNKLLPVKLPFFVDAVINNEYLIGDKPIIKIRSFGDGLKPGQQVSFVVESPTLGLSQSLSAKAFESVSLNIPNLTEGEHKITITGQSGDLKDQLIRQVTVTKTRLTKEESNYQVVVPGLQVKGSSNAQTTLIFSDLNRGRFYPLLLEMSNTYGDRVDQRIARVKAQKLITEYFKEESQVEEFKADNYQLPTGGISLFPYSDEDLAVSAKVAAVANDVFDKDALRGYFYKVFDDPKEGIDRTAISLYGLASLGEPVLVPINQLLQREDLTPIDKLYLGLGRAQLGDKEGGRVVLREILEKYGQQLKPYIQVKVGKDQDDIVEATSLASDLASLVNEENAENLYQYIINNATKDTVIYLEQLYYAANTLPTLSPQPVEFTYNLNGQKITKKLEKGESYKVEVSPQQLSQIAFENTQGSVGLTSSYLVPLSSDQVKRDKNISLVRGYSVANSNGVATQDFKESDLIKVTLNYQINNQALDGCYQVSDLLPSGLKVVSNVYSRFNYNPNEVIWYPYNITGQKVSFCISKGQTKPIVYYARVISKGDYQAEEALIQSLKSVDSINLSEKNQVKIQ